MNHSLQAHPRPHGGTDARGGARWDFSTCTNAAGPCPDALLALRSADPSRYPDPASTRVRHALAALHGVEPWRVLPAASASEFIQRITAVSGRLWPGPVRAPRPAYGDYALAAAACGREFRPYPATERCDDGGATLEWHADPTSPLGIDCAVPEGGVDGRPTVLDAVYEPLRLQGSTAWSTAVRDGAFVLHSPNKALGLSGVRGAYAIAPQSARYDVHACRAALLAAAPSWPLSAYAEALLGCWATPAVQSWVARSHTTLAAWKTELQDRLAARGFEQFPSVTPYLVVRPPVAIDASALRRHDVAVRDTASFGLPGCWRISVQPPPAQDALIYALDMVERGRASTAGRPG